MAKNASAREAAYEVLTLIEEGAYANLALDEYLEASGRYLSRQDKGLFTELVQGIVKRRLTLDWIIDKWIQNRNRLKTGPRIVLRLGLYQLCYLDRIPDRAAIYETVELAKSQFHSGVASLVNGVLRSWQREKDAFPWPDKKVDPAGYLSVKHSHPIWIVEKWLHRYGFENTEAFCVYDNEPPVLWVRTNTLKISREELMGKLKVEGCRIETGDFAPEAIAIWESPGIRKLEAFREGLFTVQDESSMLATHGLDIQPGQRVLDACAAPGGKTTHIAQILGDQGQIVAWDVHPHRVGLIRENQKRLGITCIDAHVRDAAGGSAVSSASTTASSSAGSSANGSVNTNASGSANGSTSTNASRSAVSNANSSAARGQLYDRILVDAPCSGLGVLRRRADARWNRKPEDIRKLAEVQGQILNHTLSLLAPGGKLLYCTCTTEPEENRDTVEKALGANPDCRKGALRLPVCREEFRSILPDPARDWDAQLLPFIHGLEGFYMALIEKNSR
jgi:16S rRNA (cytosine967-C5)-methyltransferase